MAEIPASILTGLRVNFLHPDGMGSALILDLSTDEGDQRFVLPCDPSLSSEEVETIADELMAALDKLIAPSDASQANEDAPD